MSNIELRATADHKHYEICVEVDGVRQCRLIPASMHLVDGHANRLIAQKRDADAIKRESLKLFIEEAAQRAVCDI